MPRASKTMFSTLVAILAFLTFNLPQATAFSVAYCSNQNTGSSSAAKEWTWQSNGWCNTNCKDSAAFGVIQGLNCWCSDYIPEEQQDTGDCDESCAGFPDEKCGNSDEGLFIYVRLDNDLEPSGTQGASQPTSKSDKSSSTLKPSASEAHSQPTTVVSVITTNGGVVITQTVVYTPTSAPALTENHQASTNTGAIVGGVVGGVALLTGAVGGVIFFLWRRRRQQRDDGMDPHESGVTRNTSTMSKAGLLHKTEKLPQYPPTLATNIRRNSRLNMDSDSISPVSGSDKRSSRPYFFDQRLNPSAIMNMDNVSRGSFVSMDDARDYGRTLNVRNPDPDPQ